MVKIFVAEEKFNFLRPEIYGKLVVPFLGHPNHDGSVLSFNAFHVIVPVVIFGEWTPRIIKAFNLITDVPVLVKRIWKSAVLDVEPNHSISIFNATVGAIAVSSCNL